MSRIITTGYFGLINNSFLKSFKDKLYIVQDGVLYIRSELILDSELRQSTEAELDKLLYQKYKRYLTINTMCAGILTVVSFYMISELTSLWFGLFSGVILGILSLFVMRQFIEVWKVRARSIILFMFDYLELLTIYNVQNVEYTHVMDNIQKLDELSSNIHADYIDLLRYLRVQHPRIYDNHLKEVENRKQTENIHIVDYTHERYRC